MNQEYRGTLICDLDNTLYDWVAYFVPSFYAMVDQAVSITGCERSSLLRELRKVHQLHHNSEHPYALLETETITAWLSSGHELNELEPALRSFNQQRKKLLRTFPGVIETLRLLREKRVRLIAYSDSNVLAVIDRLSRLQLENYFTLIYCVEDSATAHPLGGPYSPRFLGFPTDKIRFLRRDEKKPNPKVINHIVAENRLDPSLTAYIGDSIPKDVSMGKKAGIFSIWARYGTDIDKSLYHQLVEVSHWSADDVERERQLSLQAASLVPDFTCHYSFEEVMRPVDAILAGADSNTITSTLPHLISRD